jgi:ribosomal protein L9
MERAQSAYSSEDNVLSEAVLEPCSNLEGETCTITTGATQDGLVFGEVDEQDVFATPLAGSRSSSQAMDDLVQPHAEELLHIAAVHAMHRAADAAESGSDSLKAESSSADHQDHAVGVVRAAGTDRDCADVSALTECAAAAVDASPAASPGGAGHASSELPQLHPRPQELQVLHEGSALVRFPASSTQRQPCSKTSHDAEDEGALLDADSPQPVASEVDTTSSTTATSASDQDAGLMLNVQQQQQQQNADDGMAPKEVNSMEQLSSSSSSSTETSTSNTAASPAACNGDSVIAAAATTSSLQQQQQQQDEQQQEQQPQPDKHQQQLQQRSVQNSPVTSPRSDQHATGLERAASWQLQHAAAAAAGTAAHPAPPRSDMHLTRLR